MRYLLFTFILFTSTLKAQQATITVDSCGVEKTYKIEIKQEVIEKLHCEYPKCKKPACIWSFHWYCRRHYLKARKFHEKFEMP